MKLHSPHFEKSLRRAVRKTVRASRALKRESRAPFRSRAVSGAPFFRLILPLAFGFAVWNITTSMPHPAAALAFINLATLALVFIQARGLLVRLYTSSDLAPLSLLPIDNSGIFRWQFQKFLRHSLFSLLYIVIGFAALGFGLDAQWWQWPCLLLLAVLCWATMLALALLCAVRIPTLSAKVLAIGSLPALGLVIYSVGHSDVIKAWLDRHAHLLNLILPTAWPAALFNLFSGGDPWIALALLVPTIAILTTIPSSLARLRHYYSYFDPITLKAPRLTANSIPGERAPALTAPPAPPLPPQSGITAIEEFVQNREFLNASTWQRSGPFERLLWRWLSDREKILAEIAFPNGPQITDRWKKVCRNAPILLLIGFAAGFIAAPLKLWILGFGLLMAAVFGLAMIQESGGAFRKLHCSGFNIPLYAAHPIGVPELCRMLFKFSAVQLPALLVLGAAGGALAAHLFQVSLLETTMSGLRAACLIFASRYVLIVFALSGGTNDSSRIRLYTLPLLACLLLLGILFLLPGMLGVLLPKSGPGWGLTAFAVIDAYIFFRVYCWFYHRNWFDLMTASRV